MLDMYQIQCLCLLKSHGSHPWRGALVRPQSRVVLCILDMPVLATSGTVSITLGLACLQQPPGLAERHASDTMLLSAPCWIAMAVTFGIRHLLYHNPE